MKVVDLAGNVLKWNLRGQTTIANKHKKSQDHIQARELLKETYPTLTILEEIPIPIAISNYLYLDFYLPLYKVAIEIQGEQHFKFIQHFHRTQYNFFLQKKRDSQKQEWCLLNSIQLIVFNYNEDIDEWKCKLPISNR